VDQIAAPKSKYRQPWPHSGTGQFTLKIGFTLVKSSDGKFVGPSKNPKQWYFGLDPVEATAAAVAKQKEWEQVESGWPAIQQELADYVTIMGHSGCDDSRVTIDLSKPVWPNDPLLLQIREQADGFRRYDDAIWTARNYKLAPEAVTADPNVQHALSEYPVAHEVLNSYQQVREKDAEKLVGIAASMPWALDRMLAKQGLVAVPASQFRKSNTTTTLRQAVREYLDHERLRCRLKVGKKIDPTTFNNRRDNLHLVLGMPTASAKKAKVRREVIDPDMKLADLGRSAVKSVIDFWCGLPEGVGSLRTVKNYLSALKSFLCWCDKQDHLGWTLPRDADDLFAIRDVDEPNVVPADFDMLKTVLAECSRRTRLYALMALTLGYYQRDIASVSSDEYVNEGGDWFIVKERSKERGGKKAGRIVKTRHWIMPEIVALIDRERAGDNEYGLLLLNQARRPLWEHEVDACKKNAVAYAWNRACKSAERHLQFKQLRKWGWNAIDRITGKERMAKRWAGQSGGGVAKFYRAEDYAPVTEAMKAWHTELVALGVLREGN